MDIFEVYKEKEIGEKAEKLFREERSLERLDTVAGFWRGRRHI